MMTTEPTMHLGWDSTHPSEWRLGASCTQCDEHIAAVRARYGNAQGPSFNIGRLISDNRNHHTQAELGREVTTEAKRQGREIQRPT